MHMANVQDTKQLYSLHKRAFKFKFKIVVATNMDHKLGRG